MTKFAFPWEPEGKNLSAYKFQKITDGDTPFITMSIRMLSIDAPEVHYPGTTKPSKHDIGLAQLAGRLKKGEFKNIPKKLVNYLEERLTIKQGCGTFQLEQGETAYGKYNSMIKERMGKRELFVRTSGEMFDKYGRLLAYVAPSYTKKERDTMTLHERRTFNLQMVEEGWAAPFMIYPSLPGMEDMKLFYNCARDARTGKKGFYADKLSLTGYEFRMCVRMMKDEAKGPERYCADISTGEIYAPVEYLAVNPENRLFIEKADLTKAMKKLGLTKKF